VAADFTYIRNLYE